MIHFLRLLWDPEEAERTPGGLFLAGLLWGLAGALVAGVLFQQLADFFMIAITTLAAIPLVYAIISLEAQKEHIPARKGLVREEGWLLKQHERAIVAFLWLFLGLIVAFTLVHFFGPAKLLASQREVVLQFQGTPDSLPSPEVFPIIFLNNLRILTIAIVLSLLFGAGAMLVLSWNAAVLATAIGIFLQAKPWLTGLPQVVMRYFIHGIPEITGYFVGALAGGVLFQGVVHKNFDTQVLLDAFVLTIIGIAILLVAAALEVWVTPALF